MQLDQDHLNFMSVAPPSTMYEKSYVAGFLFNADGGRPKDFVALIRKKRPAWQAGRLNGIGGLIEADETPLAAMIREFFEETGVTVTNWRCFATLRHGVKLIYMFTACEAYVELQQTTDEKVGWHHVGIIDSDTCVPNLKWLVRMAMSPSEEVAMVSDDAPLPVGLQ